MNTDKKAVKNIKLDREEQELEQLLLRGEYKSVKDLKKSVIVFKQAVKDYRLLQKTKPITIRINQEDLFKVKSKAKKSRIPYQTLLSALIHQYVEGKTRLEL